MGEIYSNKEKSLEQEINPDNWANSTNPQEHNSKNFRYLVHAFNPSAQTGLRLASIQIEKDNRFKEAQSKELVNLFCNPDQINERLSISCSLINQNHLITWGDAGLIIDAPLDAVLITSAKDVGTANHNSTLLTQQINSSKIKSPDQILADTKESDYNEIVIKGGGLKLKGFFIKVYSDTKEPLNEALAKNMKLAADTMALPCVSIEVKPEINFNCFQNQEEYTFHHGEFHLSLPKEKNPKNSILCFDRTKLNYFPSEKTFLNICKNYLNQLGLTQEEATDLYNYYSNERTKLKINFDAQSNIRVECLIGEEKETYKFTINKYNTSYDNIWLADQNFSLNLVSNSISQDFNSFNNINLGSLDKMHQYIKTKLKIENKTELGDDIDNLFIMHKHRIITQNRFH
jgi:hypothetical protein